MGAARQPLTLEFHVGLLPGSPAAEVAELAAEAERLGIDGVWVADSQTVWRDAYVTLALCAARTKQILLATGATNPVTRHPAAVAGALATLDELSGGRVACGIGVGESSVRTLGLRPARLAELEEFVAALRRAALPWAARAVPVWLAASGPRALELGGRIGDGVLFQVGSDPAVVRWALERIATAGRPVRKLLRLACAVADDAGRARSDVRGYCAAAAGTVYANVPHELLPDGVLSDLARMKEAYDYGRHAAGGAAHAELVTDAIVEAIAVAGTPEEVVPRLRELAALGIDGFCTPVAGSDPARAMRLLVEKVLPAL